MMLSLTKMRETLLSLSVFLYYTEDLEYSCGDSQEYMRGGVLCDMNDQRKSQMKTNAKNFHVWKSTYFRRIVHSPGVVFLIASRKSVLK